MIVYHIFLNFRARYGGQGVWSGGWTGRRFGVGVPRLGMWVEGHAVWFRGRGLRGCMGGWVDRRAVVCVPCKALGRRAKRVLDY